MITLFHGSDKIIERLHMKQYAAWLMSFTAPRMIVCPPKLSCNMEERALAVWWRSARKVPDTDEKAGKNTHWSRWLQRVYTPIVRSLKSVQIQACQPFFNSNLNGHKAQCCVK